LVPFSRFFSHYSGQVYKIDEALPTPGSGEAAYRACFQRVVQRTLAREFFWVLCNALSMCAFTCRPHRSASSSARMARGNG
jgi:hypothetical protein